VLSLRRDDERPRLDRQQVVLAHEARHTLVIDQEALPAELRRDSAIAVSPSMRERHVLNLRPHRHRFLSGLHLLQRSVEPRPADWCHLTHPLDTQTALP
jgi:hypothetical protein